MAFDYGFADATYGCLVQMRNMDIISNNIANVNTPGFKGDRMVFDELLGRELKTNYDQGALNATGNPLDMAIVGDGFFQVQTPQGLRLTRNGSFHLSSDGTIVTAEGYQVLSAGGAPINLNPLAGPVSVDDQGGVNQAGATVGSIGVVTVADPTTVMKEGANLYVGADGKAPLSQPAQGVSITGGHLETSNVQVVTEMVDMIDSFRAFESYQKAIQTMQNIDTKSATMVGRVG
ncbi:MAG: flagellar hook-basal body protein [Deltaproteobacteria bacterium]|nr:flagellar hook-basal body protein [Deltaproteobacteria bacterium]